MINQSGSGFFSSIPVVTKNLLIINVLFWLASLVLPRAGIDLTEMLALHYPASKAFNPIQFVSYMFMHDTRSFTHLFFNMFAVYMFGRVLESVWGPKRYLMYYMITGIGAGLINLLVIYLRVRAVEANMDAESIAMVYRDGYDVLQQGKNYIDGAAGSLNLLINTSTVGASGAVFGVLLAFGMLFPNMPLYIIPFPFPIKAKYMVTGYGLIELFAGIANFSGDNVAHFAHLGGMIFGFMLVRYWKKKDADNGKYFY